MNHIAIMNVSIDLLLSALHLPSETEIIAAEVCFDRHELRLKIAHPSFPEAKAARHYDTARPCLTAHYHQTQTISFEGFDINGNMYAAPENEKGAT